MAEYDRDRFGLGRQIRDLRHAAGLSGQALGALLAWSQSKVSKIETGRVVPTIADIETLVSALKPPEEVRRSLVEQTRILSTKVRTWRNLRSQDLLFLQRNIREVEAACKTIRVFQPHVVPGLLQTAEYARQVFLRTVPEASEREISAAVAGRLDRQHILFDPGKTLTFLISESALRMRICSRLVMLGQIDRLIALASSDHLTVAVLPFAAELTVLPSNSFVMFDDDAILVETSSAEMFLRDERDLTFYNWMFEQLQLSSLSAEGATAFLRRLATELVAERA